MRSRVNDISAIPDMTSTLRERVHAQLQLQSSYYQGAVQSQSSVDPTRSAQKSNGASNGSGAGATHAGNNANEPSDDASDHGTDSDREADEEDGLSSPLNSPLLTRSAVFLRRDGGTIVSSWVPVLLFLTVDHWLHVYDLDAKCERMSDVAAFHTLVTASKKGLELSVSTQAALCEETEFDPKM